MDFNIGNLVIGVMGAVAKVAAAISNLVSALIGFEVAYAKASEDGEIDDEEAEELLSDYKLLVGAYIALFGSRSSGMESDNQEDSFESGDDVLDFPKIQVTDGAAVTYDKNGGPSEPKSVWDCVLGVKDSISNGVSQGISNVEDEVSEAYNYVADTAKNKYKNMVDSVKEIAKDPRDTIILVGPSAAVANGEMDRYEEQAVLAVNVTHFDFDFLDTFGVGKGTPTGGGAFGFGVAKSEGGIPGLTGDGQNAGASHGGGLDYSYSSSSNAIMGSLSLGTGDVTSEAHASMTETYSLTGGGYKGQIEPKIKQVKDFVDGYIQYEKDKVTDQTHQQDTREKIKNAPYKMIDDKFGPDK